MAVRHSPLVFTIERKLLPLASPLSITGYTFAETPIAVVRLKAGAAEGAGEASGVYYLGDDVDRMMEMLEAVRLPVETGTDREALRSLLPPCGARNALDCALWDLEAKRSGRPVWALAGLEAPRPLLTTFTLGAADPGKMAGKAQDFAQAQALKLKLTGEAELDAERVRAVRLARPEVWIGIDGNQGFTPDSLAALMPVLVEADVKLIEQPFARGREADLDGFSSPIPVAADESVQSLADIESLVGRFDIINIKLDKCGGLTEGLLMAAQARRLGLGVMVGNMTGTSLAMAPAVILGQMCDIVDLDGPLFIRHDCPPTVVYENGLVSYPQGGWGTPA